MIHQATEILNNTFGYKTFRPLQEQAISSILGKKDTLLIMPTGGGKSLCYQIPALLLHGITVVVSPLISLMKDQVEQLNELGIAAVFLNSSLSSDEYSANIESIKNGNSKLLYIAPETLFLNHIYEMLSGIDVSCITIDEAHCISEWGHDFRPEYRKIIGLREHHPGAVFVAVTATATPRVQDDIQKSLGLKSDVRLIDSFDRKNLYLEIAPKTNATEQAVKFLRKYPNQSGIIYCFSRKQVDSLYRDLNNLGYSVRPYHAGLPDDERRKNQELFIKDDVQIIVATIAFGMGINKSNVRFVIHFDLPKNIESYYQEIGRSGRDGLRAHCLLLFGYGDISKIRYFISQKEGQEKRIAERHLQSLIDFAETGVCRRLPLLTYFGERYSQEKCGMCDNCNSSAKDLSDITIPAQKFLSCIKRTNEIYGLSYIVDILKGSKSEKVLNNKHDELSTYGIGNEFTKKQWFYLSHQFTSLQLIHRDEEYGSLKLTEKAYEVLKGDLPITGKIKDDFDEKARANISENLDSTLFEILRSKRKSIADKIGIPPYIVFSDKTLTEMSSILPISKKEMLGIHGLGEIKFEKYGHIFLKEIIEYCDKNDVKETGPKIESRAIIPIETVKKSFHTTGEKFNSGNSISDIMAETKYKKSTILKHMLDYISEGTPLSTDRLLNESTLSPEKQKLVLDKFDELGTEKLAPVYDALKNKVDYNELHLLRLYHISKKLVSES
ncbi:MAG: DNA helicase RecQ [Melioribacteraceae bacterium]|nr:DNA helicase RecQ [Melioribacteraceae bacterium]MCF8266286.1 DNA helicase RecQ [Melioribacteraceae bacterium]MCF8431872.1 DNA helicase RecQ [Melioribacteraceae bacterium]